MPCLDGVSLYDLTLYALLHDVGKPVLRLAFRVREGLEDVDDSTRRRLRSLLGEDLERIRRSHEELSDDVFRKFVSSITGGSLNEAAVRQLREVVAKADLLAAAERGFESEYTDLVRGIIGKQDEISGAAGIDYKHYTAPLASPSWMMLKAGYLNHVGPRAYAKGESGSWSASEAVKALNESVFKPFVESLEKRDLDRAVQVIADLLRSLKDEKIWLPVMPLDPASITELKGYSYPDAVKKSSYGKVVKALLAMLDAAADIYGQLQRIGRGVVDTVRAIMSAATMLVPSAVVGTLLPDIGLYSHSKLVAAYASALCLSQTGRVRLVVIDANGIQRFIAAPVKAAAATRIMRGRSLLVELMLDAAANYVLEVFGGLPSANVVVSEGGTIDIIIPDLDDVSRRLELVEERLHKLSHAFGHSIGFTAVLSEPFGPEEASFIHAMARGHGFAEILESLSVKLALKKASRGARLAGGHEDPEDYDTLTLEPVLPGQRYKLKIDDSSVKYAEMVAGPGKLSIGDVVSGPTHLSLAAGTAARNMVGLVGVYIYFKSEGNPVPDEEAVNELLDKLRGSLLACSEEHRHPQRLACTGSQIGDLRADIALIPLAELGALYIIVGLHEPKPYDPRDREQLRRAWAIVGYVLDEVSRKLVSTVRQGGYAQVAVKIANAPTSFIPSKDLAGSTAYKIIKSAAERLKQAGVELSFDYMYVNSYHPTQRTAKGGLQLVDLDQYGLIAVAKLDLDMIGEARALLSHWPSRLVTFSDLMNSVLAAKAYLGVVELSKSIGENLVFDVVVLYAGGDDVTVYGRWAHVLHFVSNIYRSIQEALYPLTASIGVAIDRDRVPILELYLHAAELLEIAKEVKSSVVLGEPLKLAYKVDGSYVVASVMPPSHDGPWKINDQAACWNLELLSRMVWDIAMGGPAAHELEELKNTLFNLAVLGGEILDEVEASGLSPQHHPLTADQRSLRLKIMYAYTWSRHREKLQKLNELLSKFARGGCIPKLYGYPDDYRQHGAEEVLRMLLASKPIVDCMLLALRRPDTVRPSKAEE
jgi:CRISPR-associated protein Csm1